MVGFAIACAFAGSAARADAPDRARIEAARKAVITDEYQSTLPGEGGSGDASALVDVNGTAAERERERRRYDTREYDQSREPGPMSGVFAMLTWGVVIVAVALALFWLGSELLKYGGEDAAIAQDAAAPAAPDLAVIERPLGDAEELARRGEFGEAIHTLLLRTLQELARTSSVRLAPAMTSREILARVPVLADAREALTGLITAVELTHFGGGDATEADYIRCRAQFQVFARAFRGQGPA